MLGSAHMFTDQYIDKEENSKLQVNSPILSVQTINSSADILLTSIDKRGYSDCSVSVDYRVFAMECVLVV